MGTCTLTMYFLALLFIPQLVYTASLSQCNETIHFDCKVGGLRRCIPLEWMCDNVADCSTGLDEHNCNYLHECGAGMMMCRDGACISSVYKCDGEADCSDGHDENSCEGFNTDHLRSKDSAPETYRVHHEECPSPKYQCVIGHGCISEEAICDGVPDCPGGDDEVGCSKTINTTAIYDSSSEESSQCQAQHQRCATSTVCIPSYWVCDGNPDCTDGSDELNCENNDDIGMEANKVLCSADQYRCIGVRGNCIPETKTCDGVNDCFEGDDEDNRCNECRDKGCRHKCHLTQSGAKCYCPDGARLMSDGVSCFNIHSCETKGGKECQHFCSDSKDGHNYSCSCAPNYTLDMDGHSCHADKQEGQLVFGLGSAVRTTPLYDPTHSNDGYKTLKGGFTYTVRNLDYDIRRNALYLANSNGHDGELAVFIDDEYTVLRKDLFGLEYLAVDYIGGNIYFTKKAPTKIPGIYMCTSDGFFCRIVIELLRGGEDEMKKQFRGFALNPIKGMMAWIEGSASKFRIMTANMDGTNIKVLVDNKLDNPHGLAFDSVKNELYFGDVTDKVIEKINVETKERHAIVSKGVHHSHDIKFFDGSVFWSDWSSETIKFFKIKDQITRTMHTFDHFPMGIAIKHPLYQMMPSRNPCDEIKDYCKWMCVPVPGYNSQLMAVCVCPNNYVYSAEEKKCIPEARSRFFEESALSITYIQGLCAAGTACLNGGVCRDETVNTVVTRITCRCPDGYIGERCEVSDPLAKTLVGLEDKSSGWGIFWFLFLVMVVAIGAFLYLYKKNAVVNEFAKSTIDKVSQLESPDLSAIRPVVKNIKGKLQAIPGSLSSHFGQSQVPTSPEVNPTNAPLVVAFNNPMYTDENRPPSEEHPTFNDNEVTYVNKF